MRRIFDSVAHSDDFEWVIKYGDAKMLGAMLWHLDDVFTSEAFEKSLRLSVINKEIEMVQTILAHPNAPWKVFYPFYFFGLLERLHLTTYSALPRMRTSQNILSKLLIMIYYGREIQIKMVVIFAVSVEQYGQTYSNYVTFDDVKLTPLTASLRQRARRNRVS